MTGPPSGSAGPAAAPGAVPNPNPGRTALVVFSNNTVRPWLRWLKPGFRHCFIALEDQAGWIMLDPLATGLDVALTPKARLPDPVGFFEGAGCAVIVTVARAPGRRALPPGPFTCVEAVKRTLGLRAPLVLTPWQLHQRLVKKDQKTGKKSLTGGII